TAVVPAVVRVRETAGAPSSLRIPWRPACRSDRRSKRMVALGRLVLSKRERVSTLEPYDKGLLGNTLAARISLISRVITYSNAARPGFPQQSPTDHAGAVARGGDYQAPPCAQPGHGNGIEGPS